MSTSSLAAVLNLMVDRYQLGRRGTNTGTSASSITDDANLGGPDAAKDLSVGSQILITADAGAAPEGEITQLSTKPKLSTGVANLDPSLTVALANAATYIILFRPLRFSGNGGLIDRINEAQKMFQWIKRYLPITLVPDGDMIASAVANWTDTNSTSAKVAATFAKPDRNISVTDSGSGGGYTSPAVNIFVEPSKSYYFEVTGWGTDNDDSGTLQLKDVNDSNAAITLSETVIDRMEPEILRNTVTMPSSCTEVQLRLVADGVSDVVSWANVIFRKEESREFVLPDRPIRPIAIGRLLYRRNRNWSATGEFDELTAKPEQLDSGLWTFRGDNVEGLTGSLWYEEFITPADLAASTVATASTPIPAEDLAAVAAELVLAPLQFKSKDWAAKYKLARDKAAGVIDTYLSNNRVVRTENKTVYRAPAM